jgi:uroporphyrinogen III methyltransferase/synthase
MNKGKVYLVGAGPGAEDLISLKAVNCIKKADVIIYDFLANKKFLNYAKENAEKIYVGKKGNCHTLKQPDINRLIIEKALQGNIVTRLKGGDPYIFGRGGEEAEELVKEGIEFEVVPGITAGVAASAYAGIPLTHRDFTSTVAFVTGHERDDTEYSKIHWDKISTGIGTIVFYMGVKNLPNIVENLIANGRNPETPIALVRWGTLPVQKTVTGKLSDIVKKVEEAGLTAPAIIVVGEVVNIRETLRWFDKKPLFGKNIIITRAREQASSLTSALSEYGANVLEFPTIEISEPDNMTELDNAIDNIKKYNWLIFTSVNGVKIFFKRLFQKNKDSRALSGLNICAIGPKTAETFEAFGIKPDFIPEKYQAEYIIEGLKKRGLKGMKFLLPRAKVAREILPEKIKELGGEIDVVTVYKTVLPDTNKEEVINYLKNGNIHYITFTSSSTVKNFFEMFKNEPVKNWLKKVKLVSIGPITSETLREQGFAPSIEAKKFTIEGIVEAIIQVRG